MTKLYLQDDEEDESGLEKEFEEDDDTVSADVENGVVCANCEAEFEKEQGTPSLCPVCWGWGVATPAGREEYHQADCGTIR